MPGINQQGAYELNGQLLPLALLGNVDNEEHKKKCDIFRLIQDLDGMF